MNSIEIGSNTRFKKQIMREAEQRTIKTIEALNVMCEQNHCSISQNELCSLLKTANEQIIALALKGFTITALQCNLGNIINKIDPSYWVQFCNHCQRPTALKCKYRTFAEQEIQLLRKVGFIINDLYCQFCF